MPIKRYLSEINLERFKNDFKNLIRIIRESNEELNIAIRDNYINVYYKGNSLAKIVFKISNKYNVSINKAFFKPDLKSPCLIGDEFYERKKETGDYFILTLSPSKPPIRFFQKKHINRLCSIIKKVNYGEEIVFEQELITGNSGRSDLIIIDRQITDAELKGKRMDLLALKQINKNKYGFLVIEVKLGNNPELEYDVAEQLSLYVDHIKKYYQSYSDCYQKQYEQLNQLGLLNCNTIFDKITITNQVEGKIIVGGYQKIAENQINKLKANFPKISNSIQLINYKIKN